MTSEKSMQIIIVWECEIRHGDADVTLSRLCNRILEHSNPLETF